MSGKALEVLMVGPSRDSQGGISAVVNGCYAVGLADVCNLTYLSCTDNGGKVSKLATGGRALLWSWAHAREFDVVHVHMGGGNSYQRERLFVKAGVNAGVPVILHIHDGLFRILWEQRAGEALRHQIRETFESAARLIVLSSDMSDYIKDCVSPTASVVCIPNGVEFREDVVLPKERGTILFLGHFDNNKNAAVLVRAMAQVRKSFPWARAYFGADGDVEGYRRLVDELGLLDTCVFLGWVGPQKKQEMLDRCSIYCLPSKNEAMPMGLLEAMSNELAPVVTPVGGILDIVEDGRTGVFVSVNDEAALADAIIGLIRDEGRRSALAEAGRQRMRERFSLENVVASYLSLYRELAAERNVR